jgi:hypothetical protein
VRILVVLTAVVSLAGCVADPDAATRDRAQREATEIAEDLELPPGYEVVNMKHVGAQTPRENRGGGQSGYVWIEIATEPAVTTNDLLDDLDGWFSDQGMRRAEYAGRNVCDGDHLVADWTDASKTIAVSYWVDGSKGIRVPYGFGGLVVESSAAVESPVPLPKCSG